jgi:anti-sigma factor RsiW
MHVLRDELGGVSWASLGAGFAAGLLVAVLALPWWPSGAPSDALAAELVAQHVHALRDGPLTQVASNDRHNVKPWFQGKLDYAPPVLDLADAGFVLRGGRVEPRHGHDVAVLVYQRRLHVIELFVWPVERGAREQGGQAPRSQSERGFQLVTWGDRAMQYGAVSDVERAELERFSRLRHERLPAP